ncbi:GspH/FimT family pseudopilin [Xanthomonas arboricola]|uniref:GspH/FimT family pseudopilin n=1 Tax=Xanthomonas arboricola TaxID=56448 RepID=UPI000E1EABB8|nr:GspH/FimT family pseudopilin [Xanthomonas arboricola]
MEINKSPQNGFSLIEGVVTVALLAVASCIAWPSLSALYRTHQVRAAMFELAAHLATARSTSIARGSPVGMCPMASSDTCATDHDWTSGWLVYVDPDGNRRPDTANDVIVSVIPTGGARLSIRTSSGRTQVRYGSLGTTLGTNVTFHICHDGILEAQVIVSVAGRPRSLRPSSRQPCPS